MIGNVSLIPERPRGRPLMRMRWRSLLFMHWRVDAALLRPLVPDSFDIDTFDGSAWVGLIPFTMDDVMPAVVPRLPLLSRVRAFTAFHECNVRTYVTPRPQPGRSPEDRQSRGAGEPGVWFFSLDAASRAGVWAARRSYHLNYFFARIRMRHFFDRIEYGVDRVDHPRASMRCAWSHGRPLPISQPGELAYFLTERYCLYSANRADEIFRSRIWHHPWPLHEAKLLELDDGLVRAAGIDDGALVQPPVIHHAPELRVYAWGPRRV